MGLELFARESGPDGIRGDIDEQGCLGIEGLVSAALGVALPEMRGRSRRAPAAFARQAAMYLAHVKLGLSLSEVGAYFGRDRTTVSHACSRMEDFRDDPRLECVLDCVEAALDHWRASGMAMGRQR